MKLKNVAAGALALLTLICATVAYAITVTNDQAWHLTRASRPAHLSTGNIVSTYDLGQCVGDSCPHYQEDGIIGACTAKTSAGVVMNGWNWIRSAAVYIPEEDRVNYVMLFVAENGTWPAVLPTGCNGAACPQWPAAVTCTANGDDPPGPEYWIGQNISYTVALRAAVDPDLLGDAPTTVTPATGKTITIERDMVSGNAIGAGNWHHNLAAGTYVDTVVQARAVATGSLFPGVWCHVDEKNPATDTIRYSANEAAVLSIPQNSTKNLYCRFKVGSAFVNSPLNLFRE